MIRNSFIFLDKIGKKAEQNLWKQGIKNWNDFANARKIHGLSKKSKSYYDRRLKEAANALYNFDSSYFVDKLPLSEMWRLYNFFKEDAIYLDIETSGVDSHDDITVFGLYDGVETKIMIRGINLDYHTLKRELKQFKIIVTFNGASFDIPFIKKRYPGLIPAIPHIDIRHVCDKVKFTGGLKEIEKQIGIKRNIIIEKMYSGDPLRLWRMYRASGDEDYLNLLVEYNEDDVINLKTIADISVNLLEKNFNELFLLSKY